MSFSADETRHSAPCWFGSAGKFKPGASNSDTDAAAAAAAAPEGQRWALFLRGETDTSKRQMLSGPVK